MTTHPHSLSLMAALMLGSSACAAAADGGSEASLSTEAVAAHEQAANTWEADSVGALPPSHIALKAGAQVAPDEIDGYCEDGVGVYLSADDDTAQLMLYVVAPAHSAVFWHPAMQLTVRDGDSEQAQFSEFETFELNAGESRVFTMHAEGKLMNAAAEVSADSDAQATLPQLAQASPTPQ